MKRLLEMLLAIVLHPVAFLLMMINLIGRSDLSDGKKIVWAIVGVFWGVGPILYILVGEGAFW